MGLFEKKSKQGVEDMEFLGVLNKQNVEIPGSEVNTQDEVEFPGVIQKKSCGISMGLGFWPWKFLWV